MTRFSVAAAVVAVTVAAQTVYGQDTGTPPTAGSQANADSRTFIQEMLMAGMAEVHLGNLAAQQASDADVTAFGQMMVKDHAQANTELEQIATQLDVQPPKELDQKHRDVADRLATLTGAGFDREYMRTMVQAHEEVAAKLRTLTESGGKVGASGVRDREQTVLQWAAKTLPIVQQHLERAKQLQQRLPK